LSYGAAAGTYAFHYLAGGTYLAVILGADRSTVLGRSPLFTVTAALATDQSSYAAGAHVVVSYNGMPGAPNDTIVIANTAGVVQQASTGGSLSGSLSFSSLSGGTYVARAIDGTTNDIVGESPAFSVFQSCAVTTDKTNYYPGDLITANYVFCQTGLVKKFTLAPDGSADDVAVSTSPGSGLANGSVSFKEVPPGTYRARMFDSQNHKLSESPALTISGACTSASQCTTGNCIAGVCCNNTCGPCGTCSDPAHLGQCHPLLTPTDSSCQPYACDGVSPACVSACDNDAVCARGFRCANHQCVAICTPGGSCVCGAGEKYCASTNSCIDSDECCTAADCGAPPDGCSTSTGAICVEGSCVYPPIGCSTGQACTAGTCATSPVSIAVSLNQTSFPSSPNLFEDNGPILFTLTLTNTGSSPLTVSSTALDTISIVSVQKDGAALTPALDHAAISGAPSAQYLSLVTLQPGSHTSFTVQGILSTLLVNPTFAELFSYAAQGPGAYSVVFRYQYSGDSYGHSDIFTGSLIAAPAVFNVQ
jgi:hypothetical protein